MASGDDLTQQDDPPVVTTQPEVPLGNSNTPPLPSPPSKPHGKITNELYLKFLKGQTITIVKEEHIQHAVAHIQQSRKKCKRELIHFLICMYYTGARPAEILKLTRENFTREKGEMLIDMPTVKGGLQRLVLLRLKHPLLAMLWKYVQTIPPHTPLFEQLKSSRHRAHTTLKNELRLNEVTTDLVAWHFRTVFEGTEFAGIPAYYLRHSRFTSMAEKGASMEDIMISKGARDLKSVRPYIHRSLAKARKLSKLID